MKSFTHSSNNNEVDQVGSEQRSLSKQSKSVFRSSSRFESQAGKVLPGILVYFVSLCMHLPTCSRKFMYAFLRLHVASVLVLDHDTHYWIFLSCISQVFVKSFGFHLKACIRWNSVLQIYYMKFNWNLEIVSIHVFLSLVSLHSTPVWDLPIPKVWECLWKYMEYYVTYCKKCWAVYCCMCHL